MGARSERGWFVERRPSQSAIPALRSHADSSFRTRSWSHSTVVPTGCWISWSRFMWQPARPNRTLNFVFAALHPCLAKHRPNRPYSENRPRWPYFAARLAP